MNQVSPLSSLNEASLSTAAPDIYAVLKKKVQETFLGLIPEESMQQMIDDEIRSFFELQDRVFTPKPITVTRKEAMEAGYHFTGDGWDKSPGGRVTATTLHMVTPMSPFRHIVWNELGEMLVSRIRTVVKDKESRLNKELDAWFETEATTQIEQATVINFNALSTLLAKRTQYETMKTAIVGAGMIVDYSLSNNFDSQSGAMTGTVTKGSAFADAILRNLYPTKGF
jgi:hypothetical protein